MKIHHWGKINAFLHLPRNLGTSLLCSVFWFFYLFFVLYLCSKKLYWVIMHFINTMYILAALCFRMVVIALYIKVILVNL